MNARVKFGLVWFTIALYWVLMARAINGIVLMDEWMVADVFRPWPEEVARHHFLRTAYVIYAGLAVWVFTCRYSSQRKTWLTKGLEYGALLAMFTYIPMFLITYTIYRLPGLTVVKAAGLFGTGIVLVGLFLAFVYRNDVSLQGATDRQV